MCHNVSYISNMHYARSLISMLASSINYSSSTTAIDHLRVLPVKQRDTVPVGAHLHDLSVL